MTTVFASIALAASGEGVTMSAAARVRTCEKGENVSHGRCVRRAVHGRVKHVVKCDTHYEFRRGGCKKKRGPFDPNESAVDLQSELIVNFDAATPFVKAAIKACTAEHTTPKPYAIPSDDPSVRPETPASIDAVNIANSDAAGVLRASAEESLDITYGVMADGQCYALDSTPPTVDTSLPAAYFLIQFARNICHDAAGASGAAARYHNEAAAVVDLVRPLLVAQTKIVLARKVGSSKRKLTKFLAAIQSTDAILSSCGYFSKTLH